MKRLPIDLALAATLVLAACARTASAPVPGASSSPSEAPSATPLPSMSPAILPARSVRVVVNGVELATRSSVDLTAPADAYVFGSGWLPDGRVVLVGGAELWSGQPSGPLTRIADLKRVHALAATPSPRGTFVGIVGTDAVWVADLRDGAVRAVAGSTGGCGNGLA